MANLRQLKEHDVLTLDEVKEHFPGALERLISNYDFTLKEDPEGFKEQFGVSTAEEVVNGLIKFYVVDNDGLRLAFTEPNLGTNVEAVWYPEEECDGEMGDWVS